MPVLKPSKLLENRVEAIKDYHDRTGAHRAQLDVSGGIDSAVLAGLLLCALGPKRVTLSHTVINTNTAQTNQAATLAKSVGCPMAVGEFTAAYETIRDELLRSLVDAGYDEDVLRRAMDEDPTIEGSIRSTLRAPLGRGYNRITGGGIRHGTGNECEDRFLRFYQKGGDGEVDTNPIAMLSKTEVYQLAFELGRHLDAMEGYAPIIDATPTPDLWDKGDDHNDEDELLSWTGAPFTYGRIDVATGKILSFGTIEMVSRFIDSTAPRLFDDALSDKELDEIVGLAHEAREKLFHGVSDDNIERLVRAARKFERATRHKMNPNIPTLGDRSELLAEGILGNDLIM